MGDTQVLMFDAGEREHPTKPGETVHVWRLMVQERDTARRPQARNGTNVSQPPAEGNERRRAFHSDAPAKPSASPVARGDGWRGSRYVRPANGAQRAQVADDGAFHEDSLEDIGRAGR
jgi:hypothetical protein